MYIYIYIYNFFFFLVRFFQSHLLIILLKKCVFFWNFQEPKGEHFSLSTHLRCFSPTVMFFFECTFEHSRQCSFKAGSRNPLRGVVFFLGNNNSGKLSLTRLK